MRRNVPRACAILACLFLLLPRPALAWNSTGHEVVARIAWSHLSQPVRERVIALMLKAPKDTGLPRLFKTDTATPLATRQREFFLRASTWPDLMRDAAPAVKNKYHRRDWHFINIFWEENENGVPVDIAGMESKGELVRRLTEFRQEVIDAHEPAAERAYKLAWILHLVGDIHQPLHTSGRVTDFEPEGDLGGNLFCLAEEGDECTYNLHSYWDGILSRVTPKNAGEDAEAYASRIAGAIMTAHPRGSMASQLKPDDFRAWAREGVDKAKRNAYPASLERLEMPSTQYRTNTHRVAAPSAALAGYRLAETLNRMFQ